MVNPLRNKLNQHANKSGRAYIEARVTDLNAIYTNARGTLEQSLIRFVTSGRKSFTGRHLTALTEEIQKVFPELEESYREKAGQSIHYLVQSYYRSALSDLSMKDVPLGGFNKAQMQLAMDDMYTHIAGATTKMNKMAVDALRRISAKVIRESALTGETQVQISKRLFLENGGTNFIFTDAKGAAWNGEAYFDMLSRTLLNNNSRESYLQACADQGSDIVSVSISGKPCPKCAVWEDRLLSISGKTKGLPTLDEAIEARLFHPNCTHHLVAVPPEIAEEYYTPEGRPQAGLNSPGNEERDDKDAWREYRFEQRKQAAKQAVSPSLGRSVDAYYDGLSAPHKNLVRQYTNADERGWNQALRTGQITGEQQKEIDQFSDVLAGFPKYQGDVWRGLSFDTTEQRNSFLEKMVKDPESIAGFTSTTVDLKSAKFYAEKSGRPEKVFVKIENSTQGAYVGHISHKPGDKEALFDHKIKFEILDKTEKDGIVYITAKEVMP